MAENNVSIQFFLIDNLKRYTENLRIISNSNPFAFEMNGTLYSIHASEIHDSGEGRANKDEWRIQLQGTVKRKQKDRAEQGYRTLCIGFFPDGSVFSAWEPARIASLSLAGTGSVYIPHSDKGKVIANGGALRTVRATNLGRKSAEVSLPAEALGFYLENASLFAKLDSEADLRIILEQSSGFLFKHERSITEELQFDIKGQRERVSITREAYRRDPRFRRAVMHAYDGRCCICQRQIGLVEAAHIVPHGNPMSSESVTNGLALCVEHHRLYDNALLIPDKDQKLFLNPQGVEHLENIGQGAGLDDIRRLAEQMYRIPEHAPYQPDEDFLELGKRIRLGTPA